jgi:roadblock/LC7 domain-containing protein
LPRLRRQPAAGVDRQGPAFTVCNIANYFSFLENDKTSLNELVALAHFAPDYKRIVQGDADQLSMFTGLEGWTPPAGWIVRGATLSVCSVANLVCTVEKADGDLSEVMETLAGASLY